MASIILRSRILSFITKNYKLNRQLFCSNASSNADKQSIIAAQSLFADQAAAQAAAEPPAEAAAAAKAAEAETPSSSGSKAWSFFRNGLIATLTGASAFAGYASYAYTLEEVEEKTKALRESINAPHAENYRRLLYSAAMPVPAKAAELYLDMRRLVEEQVRGFTEPPSDKLLPDLHPSEQHVFTLVLDLNETLIYSDWKRDRGWRTFKRPGVDAFLQHLGRFYEIVVYSDQLSMYVDPVIERLDTNHFIRYRLSRTATKYQDGKHYRDLSKLNRDPAKILYVSGHAFESSLQPENCIPIKAFKIEDKDEEPLDTALLDLIPFLEYVARASPADIRTVLASYERKDIAKEFLERSKDYQKRMEEQRQQGRFWRH